MFSDGGSLYTLCVFYVSDSYHHVLLDYNSVFYWTIFAHTYGKNSIDH